MALRAYTLIYKQEAERTNWERFVRAFEISEPTSSNTTPPIRPHLLSLPKEFH